MALAGISPALLPPVHDAGEVLAPLRPRLAQRTGLAGALLQKDVRLVADLADHAAATPGAVLDAADAALALMKHPR